MIQASAAAAAAAIGRNSRIGSSGGGSVVLANARHTAAAGRVRDRLETSRPPSFEAGSKTVDKSAYMRVIFEELPYVRIEKYRNGGEGARREVG